MGPAGLNDFDVTPVPGDDTRFTAVIGPKWMLVAVPQGGVVAALALQAMTATLDVEAQSLRSLSAVFAGQVASGPVEIEVAVLRRGRSMSQLTATVRNPGAPAGLTAIAVFGAPRRGFEFTELTFPDVAGPDGLRSYRDPLPEGIDFTFDSPLLPFWCEALDARPATGRFPWEDFEEGPAEVSFWYRLDTPPLLADGSLHPAGLIVMGDTMPGAVSQKLGQESWFGPSADFTIHILGPARPGWFLAQNRARHAGDGYASVEMALWDPTGPHLVAYATQMMFFAFGP